MRETRPARVTLALLVLLGLAPPLAAQPAAAPGGPRLAIYAVPNPVLGRTSDETLYVFVQLQDQAGRPVAADEPLVVTLASSDLGVLRPYGADGHLAKAGGAGASSVPATPVPMAAASAPPAAAAQEAARPLAALEAEASRLGAEAAKAAHADPDNAERLIADRYRQALDLTADETLHPRLTEAFRRGYASQDAGANPPLPGAPAPAAAQPAPPLGPRLFDVTAARGVAEGRPVGPGGTFTPATNPIYVWFRHEGVPAGAPVTSVWYYLETSPVRRIADATMMLEPPTDWGQFNLELPAGRPWPVGNYRVDLLVAGQPAAEARFEIVATAAAAAAPAPAEPRLYTHPRSGFQILPPPGWTLDDRVSPADLQMKSPGGEGLMEITSGPTSTKLDPVSYAAGWESNAVGPDKLLRAKRAGRPLDVAGEHAYQAVYEGDGVLAKVLFVGFADRFFVMTGVFRAGDFTDGERLFDRMVESFRPGRSGGSGGGSGQGSGVRGQATLPPQRDSVTVCQEALPDR